MAVFYQAGVIGGLLQGVYEGDVDLRTVSQYGDLGLGTFNGVDGELVVIDGRFYRIDATGKAYLVNLTTLTPFSVVAKSQPTITFFVEHIPNMLSLNNVIDSYLPTPNIFYMIRIDATLEWIKLRSEHCQQGPVKPLADTLPTLQENYELNNIKGSLVITRCPDYSAGITIPGYHYHFIDDMRQTGGHVFELKLTSAQVKITPLRQFNLVLFNTSAFDQAHLTLDLQDALNKTER